MSGKAGRGSDNRCGGWTGRNILIGIRNILDMTDEEIAKEVSVLRSAITEQEEQRQKLKSNVGGLVPTTGETRVKRISARQQHSRLDQLLQSQQIRILIAHMEGS